MLEVAPDSLRVQPRSNASPQPRPDILVVPSALLTSGILRSNFACLADCRGQQSKNVLNKQSRNGAPITYVGRVFLYRGAHVGTRAPSRWSDFWDTAQYPGPRALQDSPRGVLEIALIADGVPAARLYPLDIDRAFRRLAEIRPYVSLWWTTEGEVAAAMQAGTLIMAEVPNTFVSGHVLEMRDGEISTVNDVTALDELWAVIPTSVPVTQEGRRLLDYAAGGVSRRSLTERGLVPVSEIPELTALGPSRATNELATASAGERHS